MNYVQQIIYIYDLALTYCICVCVCIEENFFLLDIDVFILTPPFHIVLLHLKAISCLKNKTIK